VNPKAVTWALGALALFFVVVLTVVLLQGPATDARTGTPQATSAPQTGTTPEPAASPTAEVTDAAAEGGPSPFPSSEVEVHDASPYSQTDEARRGWEPVATGFGKAFTTTKGKDAAAWRSSLAPFVTDKVKNQLATVALANVPAGTYDRIEPAEFGEDKIAVFVHYDTGLTLVTYLILDGTSWRIYAYDRWED
jgi:hypothetical protein